MITYKDNPKLQRKVVTTVRGDKEYRLHCRLIKGDYYVKNRDCFEFDGKWYRYNSGKIEFNHTTQKWILKNSEEFFKLIQGIVGSDEEGRSVIGMFEPDPYNNVMARTELGQNYPALNEEVLHNHFMESISSGVWYNISGMSDNKKKSLSLKGKNHQSFTHKAYSIEENRSEYQKKTFLYSQYNLNVNKDLVSLTKMLNNFTFGLEIETSTGSLPENIENKTGIVMCRDGSISGGEAVTIPLEGAKGIENIKQLARELTKRCTINTDCSFHIHLGTVPTDRSFLVSLYKLSYLIQDEVFKMFPYYKTDPTGVKRNDKNYCKKLKKLGINNLKNSQDVTLYKNYIDDGFEKIFVFVADGHAPSININRKNAVHPIQRKWDRPSRYFWINFQNMFFGGRETIEFRLHHGTLNAQKMLTWLFMCVAMIHYADKNKKSILEGGKISFIDVLNIYKEIYSKNRFSSILSDYLVSYYNDRCSYFEKDMKKGDYISKQEAKDDETFIFEPKNPITQLLMSL